MGSDPLQAKNHWMTTREQTSGPSRKGDIEVDLAIVGCVRMEDRIYDATQQTANAACTGWKFDIRQTAVDDLTLMLDAPHGWGNVRELERNQLNMPELRTEKIYHADPYLVCDKSKGHSKKHIAVCKRCRWRKKCRAYQLYWQPELPLMFTNSQPECQCSGLF